MSIFIGVDPGAVSGALGAVDHDGNYLSAFDIEHKDKHILALVFKSRILSIVDPKEGAEICMEQVHSMPNQGVSSTFAFGRAVGVISAVCELTKKDINKAEALLIAEYLRHILHGAQKTPE